MPLNTGTRLGPYQIEAAIGAGGMGEVYRARDTRLDRTVAIKVLPTALASDPQFRERFEREARSISALNQPHLCTLHDVGSQDGVEFLVMEHLEGETLAERLKRGPLPIDETLDCAVQIADALDKAHKRGIVHRDLKPGNVMLTKSGAKLLDFGLAKLATAPSGAIETRLMTTPPAGAAPITSQGSLLGTFQYMAPEQIEGQDVDARADLWAFGCVLYEMATGRRAFEGKTQASLIASILERQPTPISELQPMTPPALGRIVRTCLANDPEDRFQTAHDLWLQLQWIEEGGSAAGLAAPVMAHRRRRERAIWFGLGLALASAAGVAAWLLKPAPPVAHVVSRFEYPLPDGQTFTRAGRHVLAISPDGTKIVYVANQQLYLRSIDQLDAHPIPGTAEDPLEPVFSPDGQWIAYFTPGAAGPGALRKIAIGGGAPVTLCQTKSLPFGASWRNGTIVFGGFVPGEINAIQAVSDSGGVARTLVSVDPKEGRAAQPQLLDDGTHVVFAIINFSTTTAEGQIVAQGVEGGSRKLLVNGGTNPQVLPTGQLVYIHDDAILGVPFDVSRLTTTGGPVSIVQDVVSRNPTGAGQFAISRNGTLVYMPGGARPNNRVLVWLDRQSREVAIGAPPRSYEYPRLSPDGTKIAMTSADEENDVWIWDLVRETPVRLTFGPAVELYPTWMPDGRQVVFRSADGSRTDIFRKSADGTGAVEALTRNGSGGEPQSLSPDGKLLVYRTGLGPGKNDLMLLPLDGSGAARPLLADPKFNERNGEISPDGRWIAYESDESGQREIYVRPFPAVDAGRWAISSGGGQRPAWARSGRELFFQTLKPARLMATPVQPGQTFTYGRPQPLLDFTLYDTLLRPGRNYDVASDERFLVTRPLEKTANTRQTIIVVSHWFDEVQARVK